MKYKTIFMALWLGISLFSLSQKVEATALKEEVPAAGHPVNLQVEFEGDWNEDIQSITLHIGEANIRMEKGEAESIHLKTHPGVIKNNYLLPSDAKKLWDVEFRFSTDSTRTQDSLPKPLCIIDAKYCQIDLNTIKELKFIFTPDLEKKWVYNRKINKERIKSHYNTENYFECRIVPTIKNISK